MLRCAPFWPDQAAISTKSLERQHEEQQRVENFSHFSAKKAAVSK
jgi:hypothetical protein